MDLAPLAKITRKSRCWISLSALSRKYVVRIQDVYLTLKESRKYLGVMDRALNTMDKIQRLRAQAERYCRLARSINHPRVIAALHAMAEETEAAIVALKTAKEARSPG